MPAQDAYDVEAIRRSLAAWLARKLDGATDVAVGDIRAPGETGFSSETMLVDAAWNRDGTRQTGAWVVRTRPTGHTVFPEYELDVQYRCMELVARHSDVPVPRVLWYEADDAVIGQPFYVMERVDGVVPNDNPPFTVTGFLFEATADEQRRLFVAGIDVLARLHAIDWRAAGFQFLDRPRYGAAGLDQQFGYYDSYLAWASKGRPQPTVEAAFAWLKANRPEGSERVGLNWGDARLSNMITRDFRPVAVVDWEMATLGPGEVDLGWFLYLNRFFTEGLGVAPLPGFLDTKETVALYEERAGRRIGDIHYYEVWAGVRFGVIFIRLVQRMEAQGVLPAGWSETNNMVIQLLASVAGLPAPR